MEWLKKLSNAMEYIENHLDSEISYEEAARIACCSSFYFQRMFSYIAGISLSEYIRRRRMTQAGFELQRTDVRVLDVALKYGYQSPTSFNRAFQNIHGITPTAAKNMGSSLHAYAPIKFSIHVTGGSAMPYHITAKKAMRIVGIRIPLSEQMEENHRVVPEFWKRTRKGEQWNQLLRLSSQTPQGILGVSVLMGPKEFYYYIAAATDQECPDGMYEYKIPEAVWVVFENDGPLKENVQSVFKRFYMEWLPFSGYEYAGLPDLEVYSQTENLSVNGHSEVWIAIKKEEQP